jgi:hypothetical protein
MQPPPLPSEPQFPIFEDLNFTCNWNGKLHCDAWTDIRLSDKIQIGSCRNIKLNGDTIYTAECISKTAKKLNQITEAMWLLSTGMDLTKSVEKFKDVHQKLEINWDVQNVYIYVFKRHNPPPTQ